MPELYESTYMELQALLSGDGESVLLNVAGHVSHGGRSCGAYAPQLTNDAGRPQASGTGAGLLVPVMTAVGPPVVEMTISLIAAGTALTATGVVVAVGGMVVGVGAGLYFLKNPSKVGTAFNAIGTVGVGALSVRSAKSLGKWLGETSWFIAETRNEQE